MEDMLIQVPAAQILNVSLISGSSLGAIAGLYAAHSEDGWNFYIGGIVFLIFLVGAVFFSKWLLKFLKARRLDKFNDQLEDALMSMSNALKAGFSINQAIEMIVKQNKNPISLEFKLMLQQTHLGITFDDALKNMSKRVGSEDFQLVTSAIITARQTGGDLTGVFDRLAALIRERLRIQRRIRTLTAQGRLQGLVLGCLPMLLMLILWFLDKDLLKNFFGTPIGIVLFIVVILLEIGGFWVIKKIVTIDI